MVLQFTGTNKKRAVMFFSKILLVLTLAATPAIAASQGSSPATRMDARGFDPGVQGKACLDYFRARMNDPSSLEVGGTFTFNELMSRGLSGSPSLNGGWDNVYVYNVPIRARNAFGGLVLKNLSCVFGKPGADLPVFMYAIDR
jgi:hypothetical protein